MSKKIALLIGVSEYGEGIPPLAAPPHDVEAMKRVLEHPQMGAFDELLTLINPELVPMKKAIQNLFRSAVKNDLVLLFFSGHGITDDDNRLYLTTYLTAKDDFEATAMPASFVQQQSKNSYAKRQVIILDCCYSGAFAEGWQTKSVGLDLKKELGAEGRVVLTSSTATQTSFEQPNSSLSLYTQYLVEGIETGAADKDKNGRIYARELHDYAKMKVREVKPKMEPGIILDKEGFNILLSFAAANNPEEKFRELVKQYAQCGELSQRSREIILVKQREWGIIDDKATEIIKEVLEPLHQQHLANLNRYQAEYRQEVQRQYPLPEKTLKELKDWQISVLGLRDEDVAEIQQQVIIELGNNGQMSPDLPSFFAETKTQQKSVINQTVKQSDKISELPPYLSNNHTNWFEFEAIRVNRRGEIEHKEQQKAQYFTEHLGQGMTLEMVYIPGGTFMMGAPAIEATSHNSQRPQYQVTIKPFYMGKYPITQSQWQAVTNLPKIQQDLNPNPSYFKDGNRPVETVSWYDAVEFCARLAQKTGKKYRLPSEAEWEYACRAGTTTPFYFGETITTELANYDGNCSYADAPKGEYRQATTPVDSFPPNAFGLYDLHGNVWEWCADPWHDNYEGAPNDGRVWDREDNCERENQGFLGNIKKIFVKSENAQSQNEQLQNDRRNRLLRGGSWIFKPGNCRCANRYYNAPDNRVNYNGFRVVCVPA